MARYLDPKNDLMFQKIFGRNPHLFISFLNSQLTFEDGGIIKSIEYLKDGLIPDNPLKNRSVVDVHCTDNFNRQFIVEIQIEWIDAYLQRLLFDTANMYSSQLKRGDRYLKLQPAYGLAILNDTFDRETDEYYHSFEMMNPRNPEEKISGMSIVIIELEKFVPETGDEKELAVLWLRFLKEIDEEIREAPQELKENSLIGEALGLCTEAVLTDAERRTYDKCWDAIRREVTLIEGKLKEALEQGFEKGFEQGIEIGKKRGIVLNLANDGFSVEKIAKYANLTIDKVKEILKQI